MKASQHLNLIAFICLAQLFDTFTNAVLGCIALVLAVYCLFLENSKR